MLLQSSSFNCIIHYGRLTSFFSFLFLLFVFYYAILIKDVCFSLIANAFGLLKLDVLYRSVNFVLSCLEVYFPYTTVVCSKACYMFSETFVGLLGSCCSPGHLHGSAACGLPAPSHKSPVAVRAADAISPLQAR